MRDLLNEHVRIADHLAVTVPAADRPATNTASRPIAATPAATRTRRRCRVGRRRRRCGRVRVLGDVAIVIADRLRRFRFRRLLLGGRRQRRRPIVAHRMEVETAYAMDLDEGQLRLYRKGSKLYALGLRLCLCGYPNKSVVHFQQLF